MAKVSEAFANGKTYTPKTKPITDTPKGFKKWVKDHKEQIQCAKNLPYWVRDNKDVVNGIWGKNEEKSHTLKEVSFEKIQKDLRKQLIRQDREYMAIVTPKGKIVHQIKGYARSVTFNDDIASKAKNNIMIHNHPTGMYSKGFDRVGYSFSSDDVIEAISCDMKGIVAETKLYRYSLMRPEKGWGVSKDEIKQTYRKYYEEINTEYKESFRRHDIKIITQHLTMKRLSKEFGFKYEYTRL